MLCKDAFSSTVLQLIYISYLNDKSLMTVSGLFACNCQCTKRAWIPVVVKITQTTMSNIVGTK